MKCTGMSQPCRFLTAAAAAALITPSSEAAAAAASKRHRATATFGPGNCVTLSRSHEGFCRLSTDCEGEDISKFEFAFDCKNNSGAIGGKATLVRHSFGKGGFDVDEDFDTGVKCHECLAPVPAVATAAAGPPTTKKEPVAQPVTAVALRKKDDEADVVRYGPKNCISVRRSDEGYCVMTTKCQAADLTNYEMGVVCVDKLGAPKRHSFGRGSFMPEETFNTLLACDKCLAFDAGGGDVSSAAAVRYGPRACVSTYKASDGKHCMMQTQCAPADIADYEFGLLCMDAAGRSVRHLFGKHSFDPVETFNTLITCDKCLALDTTAAAALPAAGAEGLAEEVQELKSTVAHLVEDVAEIKAKVFNGPAPSGAPGAISDPALAANAFEASAPAPAPASEPSEAKEPKEPKEPKGAVKLLGGKGGRRQNFYSRRSEAGRSDFDGQDRFAEARLRAGLRMRGSRRAADVAEEEAELEERREEAEDRYARTGRDASVAAEEEEEDDEAEAEAEEEEAEARRRSRDARLQPRRSPPAAAESEEYPVGNDGGSEAYGSDLD